MQFNPISKFLISAGALLIVAGLFWQFFGKVLPLGKLPGDINIQSKNSSFHFPIVTCLLISVVISFIAYLVNRFR